MSPDAENFSRRKAVTLIENADAGKRLDSFLAERFTYHSRNEWQGLIGEGKISLNGGAAKSSRRLAVGDRIEYHAADIVEPDVDPTFEIVFSDEHILVVSKSGNLPCHPAGPFFRNTLWHMLSGKYGRIYFVNRIDRETSGLLIAARSPEIASRMSGAEYGIRKKYLALVHGHFPADLHAKGIMGPDTSSAIRKKRRFRLGVPVSGDEEYAETIFRLLGEGDGLSAVEAELVTGRLHQIRATLSFLGFPLVGDKIYGVDVGIYLRFINGKLTDDDRENLMMGRQALHSSSLEFLHPVTKKEIAVKAEVPEDMAKILGRIALKK